MFLPWFSNDGACSTGVNNESQRQRHLIIVYTVMDSRCVYWQESDTIRITIRGQRYNILRFIYIAIFQCIDHFLQPETGSNKTVFLMIYFHVSVWWWRTSVGEHVTFVVSLITNPPVQTFVSDPCGAASPRPAVCHRVFLSLSFSFFFTN